MMPPGDEPPEERRSGALKTYDLEKEKLSTLSPGVLDYDVSGNGKVLVFQTKDAFVRVDAGATSLPKAEPGESDDSKIDLAGWSIKVDPRDEWKQMLHEAWRLQRDFFYDPKMHGVDWNAVWKQYGPLADRMASRDDLEDLLGEVLGELNVGHAYHFGGDLRRGKPVGTGLLGADLDYDPATGFWKIATIYRGDYPDARLELAARAARTCNVKPGQWLVAVDGKPLVKGEDYLKRLAGRAGQVVELSISDTPSLAGARRIVVKTVANDTRIRYADWIRRNREYVDKVSNGQIGYIHLYDMQGLGLRQFARDYPPQWNKRGLIMDDRWNHGGFVAPMILAHLDRKTFAVGSATPRLALHDARPRVPRLHGLPHQPAGRERLRDFRAGLQGLRPRARRRDAHMGRLGRHPRRQDLPRRRRHDAAGVRGLGPAGKGVADRGARRRPGRRAGSPARRLPSRPGRPARLGDPGPAREDREGPARPEAGAPRPSAAALPGEIAHRSTSPGALDRSASASALRVRTGRLGAVRGPA